MAQTVFFSWQADTPTSVGRNFVRSALEAACKELSTEANIDESPRDLQVDSDTRNTAGQPPIVPTILKKIDDSQVFVGDMSFVGVRLDGRPTPNPNVLIEYGWALKTKTHERTILVMNAAYGKPEEKNLPFNLRHVLWPITYELPEDATPAAKSKVKAALVKILVKALKASLATLPPPIVELPPEFPMAEAKDPPARFRGHNESLGFDEGFMSDDSKEVFLEYGPAMWLRLMPLTETVKHFTIPDLKRAQMQRAGDLPLLFRGGGSDFLHAVDGVGTYGHKTNPTNRQSMPQFIANRVAFVFETGEIWSIDTSMLNYNTEWLYQLEFENAFSSTLRHYSDFLQAIGLRPPFRWIAGMYGLKNRKLNYVPAEGRQTIESRAPKCLTDSVVKEGVYDGLQNPMDTLMPFFQEIFHKSGIDRPDRPLR